MKGSEFIASLFLQWNLKSALLPKKLKVPPEATARGNIELREKKLWRKRRKIKHFFISVSYFNLTAEL